MLKNLFLTLAGLSFIVVSGCASLGLVTPANTDERLIAAQSTAIEAERIATKLLKAGTIKVATAEQVQVAARSVMSSTTTYFQSKASGLPVNAVTVLQSISAAYQVLLQFVGANNGVANG